MLARTIGESPRPASKEELADSMRGEGGGFALAASRVEYCTRPQSPIPLPRVCIFDQTLIRARQGTDLGPEGASQLGKSHLPHQDVVDSLCSMAEALMKGNSTEEAEGDTVLCDVM